MSRENAIAAARVHALDGRVGKWRCASMDEVGMTVWAVAAFE